jgi:hypothetical protein
MSIGSNLTNRTLVFKSVWKRITQNEILVISAALIVFILLFFAPTFAQKKIPMSSGYILQMFPWAYYGMLNEPGIVINNVLSDEYDGSLPNINFFNTEIYNGEYPLWNPYVSGGEPYGLLLTFGNFTIYRLATVLLGTMWGNIFYMFLKMYIAGIFLYLYLRYRKFSWVAALGGSLILMFSANMVTNAMRVVPDAVAFLPALLYFAERFVLEKKYWLYLGLILIVGVTIISGFPAITLYSLILVSIYLAYRNLIELPDQPIRQRSQNLGLLYLAFLAGIFLVSFTLIPTYEYFENINLGYRTGRGEAIFSWIFLGRIINPNICGNPIEGNWFCSGNYNTTALYFGSLPWMLLPFSLSNEKKKRTAWFFFGSAILIFMIVFGVASLNEIVGALPLFNINPNTRMIALLPFCFAFVTATGIDNLSNVNWKKGLWSLIYFLFLAIFVLYMFWRIPLAAVEGAEKIQYFLNQRLITLVLIGCYSFVITLISIFPKKALHPTLISLVILSFSESFILLRGYQGASNPDTFYPKTAAIRFLEEELPNYERIVITNRHFVPSIPLYYSINSLTGHSLVSVEFKNNLEIISPGIYANTPTLPIFHTGSIDLMSPILDLYRIRYVVTPPTDSPIWYEALASQTEYNKTFSLNDLITFSQSATSTRDGNIDFLEIRMALPGKDTVPAQLKFFSNSHLLKEFESQMVRQENGWYALDLDGMSLKKGEDIKFEISVDKNLLPQGSIIFGVDYNIYEGGELSVDGKKTAGDIAFSLLQYNPAIAEKYKLVYTEDMNIYENKELSQALPVVAQLRHSDQESCASTLRQIDPYQEAVVDDPNVEIDRNSDVTMPESIAKIQTMRANEIVIDADIYRKSMVILSDTYYSGWQAFVDGKQTEIYRVNCAMRGVLVDPGNHTILMKYNPFSFKIGMMITSLTMLSLIIVGYMNKKDLIN